MASTIPTARPEQLLLFTTSQTPLPPRFARPAKPVLNLPPLIHRSLHAALDQNPPSYSLQSLSQTSSSSTPTLVIPSPDTLLKHDVPSQSVSTAPTHEAPASADSEVRSVLAQPETSRTAQDGHHRSDEIESEVTIKLHLVGPGSPKTHTAWVHEALEVLEEYKGLGEVDNLMLGFTGVDYKGQKTAMAEIFGCGTEGLEQGSGSEVVEPDVARSVLDTWDLVSALASPIATPQTNGTARSHSHAARRVKCLGTLYAPLSLLETLANHPTPPRINTMDTPDCHHLPKEYSAFARAKGIELWAGGGGEGPDPIPSADLHNLLEEFTEQLDVISPGLGKVFDQTVKLREDRLKYATEDQEGGKRNVKVRWVLSYTLLSKTRNLVRDRGYIVSAELL